MLFVQIIINKTTVKHLIEDLLSYLFESVVRPPSFIWVISETHKYASNDPNENFVEEIEGVCLECMEIK